MPAQIIKKRIRFFLAGEGESEQSLATWLQMLSVRTLHIHLDSYPLGGGGFESMLEQAVRLHSRNSKTKGAYKDCFLIVDRDRVGHGEWSINKLKQQAAKHDITVCVQSPNHEGLLLRMMPDLERSIPDAASAERQLRRYWPNYQKPADAHTLGRRFSLDDLIRVANVDSDLKILLQKIGLM